ncbi:hypothetical protein FRC06_005752 [Ceratobasidium sp. 370]|nr:hypothetical protein FRC06_005752 [Ceratobasidium sp. 370]
MSVYTSSLGLPPLNGTIVLAVFNLASVIGQILFGHLCDIAPYPYVIILSGTGASLSAYLLWGFAHNLGLIFAFVVVFGSLSGGFSSIWPAACSDIVGPDHQTTVSNVFGVFGMIKGIAAVIGPIVAASLHHPHDSAVRTVYSGYGFRDVTLFVGSMMAATAAGAYASPFPSVPAGLLSPLPPNRALVKAARMLQRYLSIGRAGRDVADNSAIESRPIFVEPYGGPSSPSQTPSGSRGLVRFPTAAWRTTYAEDPRHHVSVDSPPADFGPLHPQSSDIYNHQPFLDNAHRLDYWERPNGGFNPLDSSRGHYDVLMTSPVHQVGFLDINISTSGFATDTKATTTGRDATSNRPSSSVAF